MKPLILIVAAFALVGCLSTGPSPRSSAGTEAAASKPAASPGWLTEEFKKLHDWAHERNDN